MAFDPPKSTDCAVRWSFEESNSPWDNPIAFGRGAAEALIPLDDRSIKICDGLVRIPLWHLPNGVPHPSDAVTAGVASFVE